MSRHKNDNIGLTCNTLTVTGPDPDRPDYRLTQCQVCESIRSYRRDKLTTGSARCQVCDSRRTTEGRTRNRQRSYLYNLPSNIRQRVKRASYAHLTPALYPPWQDDSAAFRKYVTDHLGPRPQGHTLDRIDPRRGYVPGNLRWLSPLGQNRNRRNVHMHRLTPDSPGFTLEQWAAYFQKLTGQRWTRRKLETLLKHLTLEQIHSAIHPQRRTPEELARAAWEREQRDAEQEMRQIVPDGLFASINRPDTDEGDGWGEVYE